MKRCFGLYLNLNEKGHPECRSCEYLEGCIERFKGDLEGEGISD